VKRKDGTPEDGRRRQFLKKSFEGIGRIFSGQDRRRFPEEKKTVLRKIVPRKIGRIFSRQETEEKTVLEDRLK